MEYSYTIPNLLVTETTTIQNASIGSLAISSNASGPSGPFFIAATGATGPILPGPTGASGKTGPTGPSASITFTIPNFSTGAILLANSSNSILASSALHMSGTQECRLDGQSIVMGSGTQGHQFVYNSYGYRTFEFFAPTGGSSNTIQTFVTDPLVYEVMIECWGAGGGGGFGGNGGYSQCTMSNLKGSQTLKLWVGAPDEGGATVAQPPFMPTVILATGPARLYNLPFFGTGYQTSIGFFFTGSQYNLATLVGDGYWDKSQQPTVVGNIVTEWNTNTSMFYGSITGTIFATGSWPYKGYAEYITLNDQSIYFFGATGTAYIVVPATGVQNIPTTAATGNAGGGASFVYISTGPMYQLCTVAGGGGANAKSYPGGLYLGAYSEGIGATSEANAPASSVQAALLPYSVPSFVDPSVCGYGASGTNSGAPGAYNTGTSFSNPYGGSSMSTLVPFVYGNMSAQGGCGIQRNVGTYLDLYGPIDQQLNANILTLQTVGGGGGGRGYAGGGGGGLYVSPGSFPFLTDPSFISQPTNPTGYLGGGGGGSNYSYNGFTSADGFHQGNYIPNITQSGQPGYIRIHTYGYINPAFTVSSSGTTPSLNITQTPGFSMLQDGTSFFSKGVAIGKTNPQTLLDVQGDISTIGNIQISNFQNIFKATNFDPVLYSIINNNFNYSNTQETVSLNYSLASLNLNIGYIENAVSGLANMLGYAYGTYNENGEIADLPFWLKQWMANYYSVSSSGLTNFVTSRQTSSAPSRAYYLQTEELLPFGQWVYYYTIYLNPYALFSPQPALGVYIENGNYYVYQKTGAYNYLSTVADLYMLNSVFATQNPYLLQQYNTNNKFNVLGNTYDTVNNEFQLGVPNLVMYPHYTPGYDPASPAINYQYDPRSPDAFYLYNPPEEPHYWYNHAFYDFGVYYTGTYASGTFLNDIRPQVGGGFGFAFERSLTSTEQNGTYNLDPDLMKTYRSFGAVSSTKTATVATVQPLPATQTLSTTTASNSTQTIASLATTSANGPVKTTVSSNVPVSATLKGTSQIVSLGIVK